MGTGLCFKCKKCGHEYSVMLGVGFSFAKEARNALKSIEKGEYGAELKEAYEKTPYAAVYTDRSVYLCSGCGRWIMDADLTLYGPNAPDAIPKKQYGEKTVEEWGYVPYVSKIDLKEDYHVVKRIYHKCDRCGKRMHKASENEIKKLPCPKCGEINEEEPDLIYWD